MDKEENKTESIVESGEMAGENMEETQSDEVQQSETSTSLVSVLEKYFPGEEITEENKDEKAVAAIEKLSGIQDNLIELAEEYPEFAMFLGDIMKGMPLEEAVARNLNDIITPPEGAPEWENINKGREHRRSMMAEKKSKIDMLDKNKQISIENAKKFIADTKLPEEEAIKFLEWIDNLSKDLFDGLISGEVLSSLHKSYTFDSEMSKKDSENQNAIEEAKIAERNKKINQEKVKAPTGDGIPKLGTSGKGTQQQIKPKSYGSAFMEGVV